MGGGGSFFQQIVATHDRTVKATNPINTALDPVAGSIERYINNKVVDQFGPNRIAPQAKAPASAAGSEPPTGMKQANGDAAGMGRGQGPSGGAVALNTYPPNTPEGDRMRFQQTSLLGT